MTLFEKMIEETEYNTKECFTFYDYTPIFESFGKILAQVELGHYEGDNVVFYNENGKYQILVSGYGSCTGCDALQGCYTEKDFNELVEELKKSIKEFDTVEEALAYLENPEVVDWYRLEDGFIDFINEVKELGKKE